MKKTGALLLYFAIALPAFGFTTLSGNILQTDGSLADVQTAVNSAATGATILLPAGSFNWTSKITIDRKAIKITGAGSGRIIARSLTENSVATGTKTFVTQSGLDIQPGQTLRVARLAYRDTFMEGKVVSYSGPNLVIDVKSTGGAGTFKCWWIATKPSTTITHGLPGNVLVTVNESTNGYIEISGIRFITNQGGEAKTLLINSSGPNAQPVLIHDCWISLGTSAGGIRVNTNKGIVWNCSFDCEFPYPGGTNSQAFQWAAYAESNSWTSASTMGAADTNGRNNFYVEDCDFHSFRHYGDFDANSRVVLRHCIMNNSGTSSHGADTGPVGLRHYEIYNNQFIFDNLGDSDGTKTIALDWWFFNRGGTGVITDNVVNDISSTAWGNKPEVLMTVMNLRRNSGGYPCWGASESGVQWPAPRQIGQGHNGSNFTLEPLYIWGNSGPVVVGMQDDSPNQCGPNADLVADYIKAGRDYFNDGTPKPGYSKYTYPHPLRSNRVLPPTNIHVTP